MSGKSKRPLNMGKLYDHREDSSQKKKLPLDRGALVQLKSMNADLQLDIRVARLKKLYHMNAPDPIIEKEFDLIRQAGESSRKKHIALRKANAALEKQLEKKTKQ